jgi:ubiquinone/menaquinone biosynthesis C-methylase UbiE
MDATLIPDLGVMSRIDGLLASIGPVAGFKVVDIGCGEGQAARAFAERGATVIGYDPFIPPTDWIPAGDGKFRLANGTADAIPEPDASADLVLFVFSLHHVPEHQLAGAMKEAKRLLKPDGKLCVAEPIAEGPNQYVMEIYHDETEVRRVADQAMAAFAAPIFGSEKVIHYRERRVYADFDKFAEHAIAGTRFNDYKVEDILSPQVRRRFDEMYAICGGNFDQPIRLNIFA